MNNKMKEKQKIERVLTEFSQYLKDTDFYEVFWSEKHGYILLGMSGDGTNVFDEASIIPTSEAFVKRIPVTEHPARQSPCNQWNGNRTVSRPFSPGFPDHRYFP